MRRPQTLQRNRVAQREIKKFFLQEGKRALTEGLALAQRELQQQAPALAQSLVVKLKNAFPLMQRIHDLAEDAREAVWCSDDPSDVSEALDDLIALALRAGATPRDWNYS